MSTKTYTFTLSINDADGTFLQEYGPALAESVQKAIDERMSALNQEHSPHITGFTTHTQEVPVITNDTHPGFTIICKACGSAQTYIDNAVRFSAESGMWGDVSILCRDCDNMDTLLEAH